MNHLARLQHDLQNHLLTGECRIESAIVETDSASIQSRLAVYRNAYQSRLMEAMSNNFPCLHAYLGNDAFEEMVLDYIESCPSQYRSIRWFGDTFPEFLKSWCDASYDYLSELAEFEWKLTITFDAEDVHLFQLDDMMQIPADCWEGMKIVLQPSVQRVTFLWNVVSIWKSIMNNEPPVEAQKNLELGTCILWRQNYMNQFHLLPQDEAWALDQIYIGATFGEICEGLCQWHNEDKVGIQAASLMKGWIQAGLIANIDR